MHGQQNIKKESIKSSWGLSNVTRKLI